MTFVLGGKLSVLLLEQLHVFLIRYDLEIIPLMAHHFRNPKLILSYFVLIVGRRLPGGQVHQPNLHL